MFVTLVPESEHSFNPLAAVRIESLPDNWCRPRFITGSFPTVLAFPPFTGGSSPSIGVRDTQTGMLPGGPRSAICVQRFDDSLISAIHITYRSWLRSSSMHEPRDPPLKVVYQLRICYSTCIHFPLKKLTHTKTHSLMNGQTKIWLISWLVQYLVLVHWCQASAPKHTHF